MILKIIGAGCILFGFFMVVYFPDAPKFFQVGAMGWTGVLIGIFSILLGIYLIKM
jgi:hypothetical protein